MNLIQRQKAFAVMRARLVLKAVELGYEVTEGESWRPPETAALYAKEGRGISNSLHLIRLAWDCCLFKGGKFLTRTEDYRELGEWWEKQSTEELELCWGGRFGDGNHFSAKHNGVR
jgi:hypothetical protein